MQSDAIYLDYNATTPLDPRVLDAMLPYLTHVFGNASSRDHAFGWDAADAVERARRHVADLIDATPHEIVFTSGATEAVGLALQGRFASARPAAPAVVVCATEHEAVLQSCELLRRRGHVRMHPLGVDREGVVDLDALKRMIDEHRPRLVAAMAANNETGVMHPLAQISEIAHAAGALVFSDLTQAAGKVPIDVRTLGVDLGALSAHKLYGPKGVGALFVRGGEAAIELDPVIAGGGQERGLRGGTLNVPAIVGFGEACRLAGLEREAEAERLRALRDRLEARIGERVPGTWINGASADRLPNTSSIGFRGIDARTLIREMRDIAVSTRSACSTGAQRASHVLRAMGLNDAEAYACVRFSLGRFTSAEEIETTVARTAEAAEAIRRRTSQRAGPGATGEVDDL
jgi:cysteine desulfurase